jgi:U3 small nucleolar RNA-associated protein 4
LVCVKHSLSFQGAHGFFCVVDLDKPVPDHSNTYPLNSLRARRSMFHEEEHVLHLQTSKKRKHSSSDSSNKNFTTCLRYSNVLFQDFLNDREMVVVEEPWRSVLEELPAVLARRVYGT